MQITATELAHLLNGSIEGDASAILQSVAKIEDAKTGDLAFLANAKYEPFLYQTNASAVLVNHDFKPTQAVKTTLIRVQDAYASFSFLLEKFGNPSEQLNGIDDNTHVSDKAQLGQQVYIGFGSYVSDGVKIGNNTKVHPQVYIGVNVQIGDNCIIYPGVKIYHQCVIGNNCIIHSNTIIGSDGFGFAPLADRSYKKIPQTGNVILEDDVEIGSNCSIDRATMGSTILRKGVKLDNLIQIAHNVEVGEHTVMAAQSGIAGSTKLGKYCMVGGQVAIIGHITVADGNQFGGQTGVQSSITEPNKKWFGTPALEVRDSLRSHAINRRLPELLSRIEALEKELKGIKNS